MGRGGFGGGVGWCGSDGDGYVRRRWRHEAAAATRLGEAVGSGGDDSGLQGGPRVGLQGGEGSGGSDLGEGKAAAVSASNTAVATRGRRRRGGGGWAGLLGWALGPVGRGVSFFETITLQLKNNLEK